MATGSPVTVAAGNLPQGASLTLDEATNLVRLLSFSPNIGRRPVVFAHSIGIGAKNHSVDGIYKLERGSPRSSSPGSAKGDTVTKLKPPSSSAAILSTVTHC